MNSWLEAFVGGIFVVAAICICLMVFAANGMPNGPELPYQGKGILMLCGVAFFFGAALIYGAFH